MFDNFFAGTIFGNAFVAADKCATRSGNRFSVAGSDFALFQVGPESADAFYEIRDK